MKAWLPALPIDAVLSDLAQALEGASAAVLEAPPGAGKSTRVPLALLDASWLGGKTILMLEPRRLAARAVASRMSASLGEAVGGTVGYRVRLESKISKATRIEVVTEGILTRRMQSDPELSGVGLVIFDEFHERSLDADLGLALCLEAQSALRPDLKILVMSATLEGERIAKLLGNAPVVRSEGRMYPVETRYLDRPIKDRFEDEMARLIRRAMSEEGEGDGLAFLPGEAEIKRVAERLGEMRADVLPLYGALSPEAQDRALSPSPPGRRKLVLATTIAETSLTIEGVRIVIDGGLKRALRFDPASGMAGLQTVRVSKASAEQRKGRAGRLGPGVCYRLWPEPEDRALAAFDAPEILQADLAPLALALAEWGVDDPTSLAWLDPPPAAAFSQAVLLLKSLEALDAEGRITPLGKSMARLPAHPRLAHMIVKGNEMGEGATACLLAALIGERDILSGGRDVDLRLRLDLASDRKAQMPHGFHLYRGAVERVRASAAQLKRAAGIADGSVNSQSCGSLIAFAYPDRIAQRRGGRGLYRLSGGRGGKLNEDDPLAGEEFLAVAHLDGAGADGRIFLAAPITLAELEQDFESELSERAFVEWDGREEAVKARRQRRLGALILSDKPLPNPDPALVLAAMTDGLRRLGLQALPWTKEAERFRSRVRFLARHRPNDGWPDFSDEALLGDLEGWLGPYLACVTRRADLAKLDLLEILKAQIPWERQRKLETLAPERIEVPSGNTHAIDYGEESPVLAVKLQEMFGAVDGPAVLEGQVALTLHLLSPAARPLAVTQDLRSFWANAYPSVKSEMRGRYPRHPWPDDPVAAPATAKTKKRM
ncbi:ATP-dependent RNA helicase HrpB [Rhodospirillaceae bacterium LM-1]|nr:ATP-dependent RNA helicase HrpB [Rhodospirillaceae bacterium LM-1]